MSKLLDSFWRAVMYCLHPRVIALSVLPVVIMGVASLGLGYFFWDSALGVVRRSLEGYALLASMIRWLGSFGLGQLDLVLAPMLLLFLAIPVIVVLSLLCVALFMTPAMVTMVASRRFAQLERKKGGSFLSGLAWSLGATVLAAVALLVTLPLWLIPPLMLILPPLIWGWLTYRVLSYDALAEHASREERRQILRENRWHLLGMGVVSGYLGAAPSLLWASGAMFVVMIPVLVPVMIWIYTLLFAFSSLWFVHYTLAALEQLRKQKSTETPYASAPEATELIVVEAISPR